jgi:cephalosporin hydroxylase
MSDYKPLTVVDDETACPTEVLIERIKQSREQNADLLQRYHDLWYSSGHTWHYTHFLGVGMMKCPNDIWMYQDLMTKLCPQVVIETGTYQGGSALWFAFLMDMLRIKDGKVLTVDIHDYRKTWLVEHPRITYIEGNSADPAIRDLISEKSGVWQSDLAGPPSINTRTFSTLVVLDSDHSAEHVYNELTLYAPMLRVGDWLVVEDTNIGWTDNNGGGDRGARGGVQDYMDQHPGEFTQDLLSERYLLTMNPGGWMQRVKEHGHV